MTRSYTCLWHDHFICRSMPNTTWPIHPQEYNMTYSSAEVCLIQNNYLQQYASYAWGDMTRSSARVWHDHFICRSMLSMTFICRSMPNMPSVTWFTHLLERTFICRSMPSMPSMTWLVHLREYDTNPSSAEVCLVWHDIIYRSMTWLIHL